MKNVLIRVNLNRHNNGKLYTQEFSEGKPERVLSYDIDQVARERFSQLRKLARASTDFTNISELEAHKAGLLAPAFPAMSEFDRYCLAADTGSLKRYRKDVNR